MIEKYGGVRMINLKWILIKPFACGEIFFVFRKLFLLIFIFIPCTFKRTEYFYSNLIYLLFFWRSVHRNLLWNLKSMFNENASAYLRWSNIVCARGEGLTQRFVCVRKGCCIMHYEEYEWLLHKLEAMQYTEGGRTLTPVSIELLENLNNALQWQ